MKCIECGFLCDHHPSGFCEVCRWEIYRNNERVMLLALLKEAMEHCPVRLREKIENVVLPAKPVTEPSRTRAIIAPNAASFGRI